MRPQLGAAMLQSVDAADYAQPANVKAGVVYSEKTRVGIYIGVEIQIEVTVVLPTVTVEVD